jgi:glucan 1,3-beta-glucosidase
VPIGFWAFNATGTPYVSGAATYLERAVGWARRTTPPLMVLIDLHGAPGSQNGFDNSGRKGEVGFLRGGAGGPTARAALEAVAAIARRYAGPGYGDVVVGIELVNEPVGWALDHAELRAFFREGYGVVRSFGDAPVVVSDAFMAPASFNGFLTPADDSSRDVAIGIRTPLFDWTWFTEGQTITTTTSSTTGCSA